MRVPAMVAALAAGATVVGLAAAQEVQRTPLPPGHPLLGTWRVDVPQLPCQELYELRADGTLRATSAEEAVEADLSLSSERSPQGFYKWVQKVTRTNGRPDCMGQVGQAGLVTTKFIALDRGGQRFVMCDEEKLEGCIGPFVRQDGL